MLYDAELLQKSFFLLNKPLVLTVGFFQLLIHILNRDQRRFGPLHDESVRHGMRERCVGFDIPY